MSKNKFQSVDFSAIDDFLDYLPQHELYVVQMLRQVILENIPNCREKLAYNVPFYSRHSNICFIWPSSVPWGKISRSGVRLGFTKGYLMNDDISYLDKGNRKQVYYRDFFVTSDIDIDLLKAYLFDAVEIDEMTFKQKRQK